MQTPHRWFGAGHSTAADSGKAGAEATRSATDARTPEVVFVFASPQHDLPTLLLGVRAEAGKGATVVGATTLGELAYDGASLGGVSVAALGGSGFTVRTGVGHIRDVGQCQAGAEAAEAMGGMDAPNAVLILLADGASGEPHEVVRGAYSVLGAAVPVVGGFAGAPADRSRTFQLHDDTVYEDAVIGVALGSDAPIGIGVAHGLHHVDPPMIVTRSVGGTVYEFDGEPAQDFLVRRGARLPAAIGLSRRNGEDIRLIAAGDPADRSVHSLADVPQGGLCWLMEGGPAALIEGAADSCAEALEGLGGKVPLGVLTFDCAGRRAMLGADGMRDEMEAMKTVLGRTPYAGFSTSAEIARVRGALGTHHLTMVTLAVA